jgi:hypothetical protein
LLGVKTGDRCSKSASVIRREFVACGVCLGETAKLWPYILAQYRFSIKKHLYYF